VEFISETGFNVKSGKEEELQAWLVENEAKLAAAYPAGAAFLGVFVVTWSSEKEAGAWRTLERLDSYGAQDTLAALMKDGASEFSRLWREMSSFGDWHRDAPWSQTLLKRATDASVWSMPSED
jgi:hypothetical protein